MEITYSYSNSAGDTLYCDRGVAGLRRTVAELAKVIGSPALYRSVAEKSAAVAVTGCYRHSVREVAYKGRSAVIAQTAWVAELTFVITSPALDTPVAEKSAGVTTGAATTTGCYCNHIGDTLHRSRNTACRTTGNGTELSVVVPAPAL